MATRRCDYFGDTDPKVPTWEGSRGAVGLKEYERDVKGYVLGLKKKDRKLAAPRLWSNLRGEAKLAVQDLNVADIRKESGSDVLIQKLRDRFPETALKSVPRAYDKLFEETHFKTNMNLYMMELAIARDELQLADPESAISETTMSYTCL